MLSRPALQRIVATARRIALVTITLVMMPMLPAAMASPPPPAGAPEPLPSWRDGASRARILAFIETVSTPGGEGYVPPAERLAVFDNDGTLWSEQPMYVQLAFAIERARALVAQRPELGANPMIAAASAAGNGEAVLTLGIKGLLELVGLTHAGMTTDVFRDLVREWIDNACHPSLKRPYTSLTYQPMRELIDLLRARGFRVYIVSAGGVEFMRVFSEELYGIPPEQVIGSSIVTSYSSGGGLPVILRQQEVEVIADRAMKPMLIERLIGRRPIAAFGNSDGDLEMLEWTTSQPGPRLGVIIHHDDPEREVAYDRQSAFGHLDRALTEAPRRGWTVVSMREDWAHVFSPEPPPGGSGTGGTQRCGAVPQEETPSQESKPNQESKPSQEPKAAPQP